MTSINRLALHTCLTALLIQFFVPEFVISDTTQNVPQSSAEAISSDDGPHVQWRDDSTAVILYFIDGEFIRKELPYQPDLTFKGFAGDDTITYTLHPQLNNQKPDIMSGVSRILAISDIHGAYDAAIATLQKSNVIDGSLAWSGGKTHLVITGDLLDRGPESRRVMDLIMRLEYEAPLAGGRVHQGHALEVGMTSPSSPEPGSSASSASPWNWPARALASC